MFTTTYTLKLFLKLKVLEELYKCFSCSFVVFSKKNIKKHFKRKHKEDLLSIKGLNLKTSYKVIAKS